MNATRFTLSTAIGTFTFFVNGANELYVSNDVSEAYNSGKHPITIRGKEYRNANLRFSKTPAGTLDGQTFAWNGNTIVNVQGDENMKARCVYLTAEMAKDASHPAKVKLYDVVHKAINEFYSAHKAEIEAEFHQRAKERLQAKREELTKKREELEKELLAVQNELIALDIQP